MLTLEKADKNLLQARMLKSTNLYPLHINHGLKLQISSVYKNRLECVVTEVIVSGICCGLVCNLLVYRLIDCIPGLNTHGNNEQISHIPSAGSPERFSVASQ
jgi:hypothetical protein